MNAKELLELTAPVYEIERKVCDEFCNRLKELYAIAQEKGLTKFGPTEEEIEDGEYDLEIHFVAYMEYNNLLGKMLAFELENDNLYITMAEISEGYDNCEIDDNLWICFVVSAGDNWRSAPYIIEYLERKLL